MAGARWRAAVFESRDEAPRFTRCSECSARVHCRAALAASTPRKPLPFPLFAGFRISRKCPDYGASLFQWPRRTVIANNGRSALTALSRYSLATIKSLGRRSLEDAERQPRSRTRTQTPRHEGGSVFLVILVCALFSPPEERGIFGGTRLGNNAEENIFNPSTLFQLQSKKNCAVTHRLLSAGK